MTQPLKIGDQAPVFTLKNKDGKEITLSDFKGKWVVIYFYPKDNTSGCTQEAKDFTAALPEFKKEGAIILGISPDSEKSHGNFAQRHALKVELLSDPEHRVLEAYGVWRQKKMAGREYRGVVRTTFLVNPKGTVEKIWEKVKVKNHVEEVRQTLCALRPS